MYLRIMQNPTKYAFERGITYAQLNEKLEIICQNLLTSLIDGGMMIKDKETGAKERIERDSVRSLSLSLFLSLSLSPISVFIYLSCAL